MRSRLEIYGFTDDLGHQLEKCQDYIDLTEAVRMGQWRPISEAPGDVEVWVCDIDVQGSVTKAEKTCGKWYTTDVNAIELHPTHYHDLVPNQPGTASRAEVGA